MAGLGAQLGTRILSSTGLLFGGAARRAPQAAGQAVRRGMTTAEGRGASSASGRAQTPAEGAARTAAAPNTAAPATSQQAASSGTPSLLARAAAQFRQMQRPTGGALLSRNADSMRSKTEYHGFSRG